MYFYKISGLVVESTIVLPGLNIVAAEHPTPDVIIREGAVPAALDNASQSGPTWEIAGKQLLLRIPGIARFVLSEGREIEFELEAGSDVADAAIFILGTVFGILLHQREQIVLHASAVRVNGKAILFCGPSGAGKSSMAAALVQRGYDLLTDDVCVISADEATPSVHSDGRLLKLWTHTIEALGLLEQRGARVRSSLEKFYVAPSETFSEPLPLGAVYYLREARPPHARGIERPNVVDAALLLRRNAYRPLIVNRMGQKANYFHAAATIANAAGIFHLTRTLNFKEMPHVVAFLERHWQDIGLTEKAA